MKTHDMNSEGEKCWRGLLAETCNMLWIDIIYIDEKNDGAGWEIIGIERLVRGGYISCGNEEDLLYDWVCAFVGSHLILFVY